MTILTQEQKGQKKMNPKNNYLIYRDEIDISDSAKEISQYGIGVWIMNHRMVNDPMIVDRCADRKSVMEKLSVYRNWIEPDGKTAVVYYWSDGKHHHKPWKGRLYAEDGIR